MKALGLMKAGINDSEIGRRIGIPRGTIREWRVGLESGIGGRTKERSSRTSSTCHRCDAGWFDAAAYAYLLGVYLGDGCLSLGPRNVYRLRIACDLRYPDIINEIATHIVIVRGHDRVGFALSMGCVEVNAYWKHWPCLFPQHGPGRKHERRIELVDWQRKIACAHPKVRSAN